MAAQDQIATTRRLEQQRIAREIYAFNAMLAAGMGRVVAEAREAREIFSQAQPDEQTGHSAEYSEEFDRFAERTSEGARYAREHFTKSAFSELRSGCLRNGGLLTGEFLELESLIDKFASTTTHVEMLGARDQPTSVRGGYHAGFDGELTDIETRALSIRAAAVASMSTARSTIAETETGGGA